MQRVFLQVIFRLVLIFLLPVNSSAKNISKIKDKPQRAPSQTSLNSYPVEIKSTWKSLGVNTDGLQAVAGKYFEQPYRYNFDNPEYSSKRIDEVYFTVFKTHLPEIVIAQIKQSLLDYQEKEGKQNGFVNEKNLVTVLPKKKVILAAPESAEEIL